MESRHSKKKINLTKYLKYRFKVQGNDFDYHTIPVPPPVLQMVMAGSFKLGLGVDVLEKYVNCTFTI